MKKSILIIALVILVIPWIIYLNQNRENEVKEQILQEEMIKFQEMGANYSSIKTLEKLIKLNPVDNYYLTKIKLLKDDKDYVGIEETMKQLKDTETMKQQLNGYMDFLLEDRQYQRFINLAKNYKDIVSDDKISMADKIYRLGSRKYQDIIQIGHTKFLATNGNETLLLDVNERPILNKIYYDKIVGFDEESGLITVVKDDKTKLIDTKGNIYSWLNQIVEVPYQNGYFNIGNNKYIDMTGDELDINKVKTLGENNNSKFFEEDMELVEKDMMIIDKNMDTLNINLIKEIRFDKGKNTILIKTEDGWMLINKLDEEQGFGLLK